MGGFAKLPESRVSFWWNPSFWVVLGEPPAVETPLMWRQSKLFKVVGRFLHGLEQRAPTDKYLKQYSIFPIVQT